MSGFPQTSVNNFLGNRLDANLAGKMIVGDSESYRYLVESIRVHPDQETLLAMLDDAGFVDTRFHNVLDGISAIHVGVKP